MIYSINYYDIDPQIFDESIRTQPLQNQSDIEAGFNKIMPLKDHVLSDINANIQCIYAQSKSAELQLKG